VVAAPGVAGNAGAAYIYGFSGGSWRRTATLADPRGATNDWYAWAVAIASGKSGTYVAVGGNDSNKKQDYIYIYKKAGQKWQQQAKIGDPGNTWKDMFGISMAITTTGTLVVGASCWSTDRGEIWIYERSLQRYELVKNIKTPQGGPFNFFGQTVSVSGNNVLVGANDSAYVFTRAAQRSWVQTALIRNPGPADDNFGQSVSFYGTTAVIGAPGGHNGGPLTAGAAYVYVLSNGKWFLVGELTAPANAQGQGFGSAVAVNGSGIVIGMPVYGTVNCGTVFSYAPSDNKWVENEQIVITRCGAGDRAGQSVAMSGSTAVFGAPGTNNQAGAVYFQLLP
jgi:hypothetical protein